IPPEAVSGIKTFLIDDNSIQLHAGRDSGSGKWAGHDQANTPKTPFPEEEYDAHRNGGQAAEGNQQGDPGLKRKHQAAIFRDFLITPRDEGATQRREDAIGRLLHGITFLADAAVR